jgi:transposase InsO family protein
MTLDQSIHAMRLRVLHEAQAARNVSATCRRFGLSRTVFYRWRQRWLQYGTDGVRPKPVRGRRGRRPQVAPHDERRVLALAVAWPTWGPQRLSTQLARDGVAVAPMTVWRVLHRHGLGQRQARLAVLERYSAVTAGLLTERTRRARRRPTPHVVATVPGELVCLDAFYVGQLKGVGKVWQLTACDAACSYLWAQLVPAATPEAMVSFLRTVVCPTYAQAGWRVQRVLTDGGGEFKGAFRGACAAAAIRHTRIQPGHAWTNGFVERVQGTILHEHWRVVFRRHYFTSLLMLQRSLDGFVHFYNHDRPHHGYKLRGLTPATAFWGAREDASAT